MVNSFGYLETLKAVKDEPSKCATIIMVLGKEHTNMHSVTVPYIPENVCHGYLLKETRDNLFKASHFQPKFFVLSYKEFCLKYASNPDGYFKYVYMNEIQDVKIEQDPMQA